MVEEEVVVGGVEGEEVEEEGEAEAKRGAVTCKDLTEVKRE